MHAKINISMSPSGIQHPEALKKDYISLWHASLNISTLFHGCDSWKLSSCNETWDIQKNITYAKDTYIKRYTQTYKVKIGIFIFIVRNCRPDSIFLSWHLHTILSLITRNTVDLQKRNDGLQLCKRQLCCVPTRPSVLEDTPLLKDFGFVRPPSYKKMTPLL